MLHISVTLIIQLTYMAILLNTDDPTNTHGRFLILQETLISYKNL